MKRLIFGGADVFKRQPLDFLQIGERLRESFDGAEALNRIGKTGRDDVAHPEGNMHRFRKAHEIDRVLQGAAAVGFVLRFRGELDVAKDEVCVLENLLGTGKVAGAGGIERGVNVVFMQAPE